MRLSLLSTLVVLDAAAAAAEQPNRRAVVDAPHRRELARAEQPDHAQRVSLGWLHELQVSVRHRIQRRVCGLVPEEKDGNQLP